jgi:hypothetical protein
MVAGCKWWVGRQTSSFGTVKCHWTMTVRTEERKKLRSNPAISTGTHVITNLMHGRRPGPSPGESIAHDLPSDVMLKSACIESVTTNGEVK